MKERSNQSRLHVGKFNGIDVRSGKCEGCGTSTRIVWDESLKRCLCSKCLECKETPTKGHAYRLDASQPFPTTLDGNPRTNVKHPEQIMVNS